MTPEQIKEYLLQSCHDCNGTFYETTIDENGQVKIDNCKCFHKLLNYTKFDNAGIGQDWWQFAIEDVEEDFDKKIMKDVKIFMDNIKVCVINKAQLYFYGKHGRGKTTIAILLLKEVIKQGYKAQIVKARHVIDKLYTGSIDQLYSLDFLVIDEFDKINSVGNQQHDFSLTVSDLMDNMGMIFVSNKSISELNYPEILIERLNSTSKYEFKGKNYRGNFESKFEAIKKSLK